MSLLQFFLICSVASLTFGKAADFSETKANSLMGLRDCKNEYSVMCFKVDIVNFVEKISKIDDVKLFNGLAIVKDKNFSDSSSASVAEIARSFPNDPSRRIDEYLMAKIKSYVDSRSVQIKLLDENVTEFARAAFTGRKGGGGLGGGKKGGYEGLLAAALMMKGTLMAVGLGALAMLAGKALMAALLALMLSSIIGLKSLSSGGSKSTTYEIIAKPHYTHSNSHSQSVDDHGHHAYHTGYGRSSNLVRRR